MYRYIKRDKIKKIPFPLPVCCFSHDRAQEKRAVWSTMAHVRATCWALVLVLLLTDAAALKAEVRAVLRSPLPRPLSTFSGDAAASQNEEKAAPGLLRPCALSSFPSAKMGLRVVPPATT